MRSEKVTKEINSIVREKANVDYDFLDYAEIIVTPDEKISCPVKYYVNKDGDACCVVLHYMTISTPTKNTYLHCTTLTYTYYVFDFCKPIPVLNSQSPETIIKKYFGEEFYENVYKKYKSGEISLDEIKLEAELINLSRLSF